MPGMPECKMFDHAVTIGPGGTIRPCCAWTDLPNTPSMRWNDDWQSRHSAWGKQQAQGWLPQCAECKQSEDLGRGSLRTEVNRKLKYATGIEYWDLKINNTCNLACRMCDAWSSSKWAEYSDIPGLRVSGSPNEKWHRQASGFVPEMLDAKEVKFTGGEPFLIPQVKHIIQELIDADVAPAIALQLTTNGTQDMTGWCDLFAHFREVRVSVSIDAVGKRYEYIRPHGDWNLVEQRVLEFQSAMPANTGIWISCLEMILNTNHMWEVEEWCNQYDLLYTPSGPILHPEYLRLDAMDRPEQRKILIEQMEILDKLHGTNWRDFINE